MFQILDFADFFNMWSLLASISYSQLNFTLWGLKKTNFNQVA